VHLGREAVLANLYNENVGRFVGADEIPHRHAWHFYFGSFAGGFAPWTPFLLPLGTYFYRQRWRLQQSEDLLPLVWFAVGFVLFSASSGKRGVYLLPIYPAAALLLGRWWAKVERGEVELPGTVRRSLATAVPAAIAVSALLALILIGGMVNLPAGAGGAKARAAITGARDAFSGRPELAVAAFAVIAAAAIVAIGARRARWGLVIGALAAAVVAANAVIQRAEARMIAEDSPREFFRRLAADVDAGECVALYRTIDYPAVFYLGRELPVVSADQLSTVRCCVLFQKADWRALDDRLRRGLEIVAESEGRGRFGEPLLLAGRPGGVGCVTRTASPRNGRDADPPRP
jgi:hypothetical protein